MTDAFWSSTGSARADEKAGWTSSWLPARGRRSGGLLNLHSPPQLLYQLRKRLAFSRGDPFERVARVLIGGRPREHAQLSQRPPSSLHLPFPPQVGGRRTIARDPSIGQRLIHRSARSNAARIGRARSPPRGPAPFAGYSTRSPRTGVTMKKALELVLCIFHPIAVILIWAGM